MLSDEYRVFVLNGEIITIDRYWPDGTQRHLSEDEFRWVQNLAKRVRSHFVSMDLARRQNRRLIVMELGDGQVSGLQQLTSKSFYEAITD